MSAAPATKGRRIGDILLELGFASEEDLAKATIEHEKTGQPLGQILVELGTHHPPRARERARRAVVRPERVDQAPPDPASGLPAEARARASPRRRSVRSSASGCCRRARAACRGGRAPADRGVRRPGHRPRRARRGDRCPDAADRGDARDAGGELRGSHRRRRGGIRRAAVRDGRARSRPRPDRHHRCRADDQLRPLRRQPTPRWQPGSRSSAPPSRHSPSAPPPIRRRSIAAGCAGSSPRQPRRDRRGRRAPGVTGRDRGAHCGARGSPGRRPGRGRRPAGRSRCPGREHRHAGRGRRAARVAGRIRAAAGGAGRGRRIHRGSR